jgi:chromosome segregation protein
MLLTKLEIKGFKSFGDRVVINFDQGITGVVGPNGCGKSNIVDAIRWVLGEQKSRLLRSDKMDNVIFNGTRTRKATQLAEVSLTFANTKNLLPTEYSEVTITRKYYRSGDSEYQLNGVTCRLKDITSLFLDTGISSNSYAIIELKMVDDILNDRDNSRRSLFEEAAGISKFKIRKKETLRKLEDTDADLERVEDLLYEIEKNMRSLERQAKQAKKYYKTKEEYKELSVKLARKTISAQKEALHKISKEIEAENDKKLSLNRQVKEKEAAIEEAKTALIGKEKVLSSRQRALNEHVGKIRQYESDKKLKNERLRFLNDKSDSLKEQLEQDKRSNERASFSINSLKQEKESAEKMLAELEAKVAGFQAEYDEQKRRTASIQEEASALNNMFRRKQDEVYNLKKDVEIKQMQLSTLRQELEKAATDNTEKSANLAEFENKISGLKDELDSKNEQLQKLKSSEADLQQRIESTEKTIDIIKEEFTQVGRKLDARQNEYNLTKSLVDNLEGFPEAIRFLRKHSQWYKNAPLLSDVIAVPEEYRVTIENFLEPYMNYYVVDSEAHAFQAVNLLSDASKGKAHFFILENFDKFNPSPLKMYDNATPATEVVEFDSKYRKLVAHVLDGVYIVKGHDQIPVDAESVFITNNGKIIKRKFSISGGSVGLFEGKRIGRAKNLEKLQEDIKASSKKLENIKDSLEQKQKELANLKSETRKEEIESFQQEISKINEQYISVKTKSEQFGQLLDSNTMRREDIQDQIASLADSIAQESPQAIEGKKELEHLNEKINQFNSDLANQNELLSIKSSAFNQENIIFHQQQNKVSSIEQEISYKQNAFETSKERIEKNQDELVKNDEEIRRLLEKNESSEDELIEMYREKEAIETGLNEAEKDYYAARGLIDDSEKQEREISRSRENIDTILMELQGKQNEIKLQLSSVKERLSVEFEIDLDQILKEADPDEEHLPDEEELREMVQAKKQSMDKIGPINPMAMEAFDEIKERFDFINNQREDLIKAKESLSSTISEIEEVARETFMDAFEKIKANFIKVFRSLFTIEDDCDLKLTNEEEPLDSPIEIMAKPKGKKPLSINQLSGGEKTLTATSLLFAIYLLKPAPFCIFDEVDAPLDDANIDKFNNIIKTFSKESQFIIVTHNKRTMASTDIIYGITMVEQGVSKVVPVDLRELAD